MDIKVSGGDELKRTARRLRDAANGGLTDAVQKSIEKNSRPIVSAQRSAVRSLPARGRKHTGLRSRVSGLVRSETINGGIKISVSGGLGRMAKNLNRGKWHHPVFGMKNVRVLQMTTPGWFDRPAKAGSPKVRKGAVDAMNDVADKIAHGGI